MARRSVALLDADAITRRARFEIGREIREARIGAGPSLRAAAGRAGMSHAQLGRLERGAIAHLTIDQLSRGCSAVGLRLMVRAVPGAGPILDTGQLALLARLRAQLPRSVMVRTEVPLPIPGDRRAWDVVIELDPDSMPMEVEARLRDIQGLGRRAALKMRDGGFDRLVLLVGDTENNRRVLASFREELRALLPLDTRQVMASLRAGKTPPASGILVL